MVNCCIFIEINWLKVNGDCFSEKFWSLQNLSSTLPDFFHENIWLTQFSREKNSKQVTEQIDVLYFNSHFSSEVREDIADLNCRSCHPKVIFGNFRTYLENIMQKTIRTFHKNFIDGYLFSDKLHMPFRSNHPKVFLGESVLKICSKFAGEHPYGSVISIKLLATLPQSHFAMGVLLHIFRTLFLRTPLTGCFWSLLLYKRIVLLLENWKNGHF